MVARALIDGLTANACTVHPVTASAAAAIVVDRIGAQPGSGLVAVPSNDAVLTEFGVVDALRAAGVALLEPDAPDWVAQLASARAGVTGATLAVARPAMLALAAAPGAPRATSLLPPVHICVVRASDVIDTFAGAIEKLATQPLPSALTWVGGPSRTGDLEMQQTLGVHGPVAVEVVVVDG